MQKTIILAYFFKILIFDVTVYLPSVIEGCLDT